MGDTCLQCSVDLWNEILITVLAMFLDIVAGTTSICMAIVVAMYRTLCLILQLKCSAIYTFTYQLQHVAIANRR